MPPGAPECPVLDVAGWFYDAISLGAMIERGGVSPSEITAQAWGVGEVAWYEVEQARRAHEWAAQRKADAIEQASKRGR